MKKKLIAAAGVLVVLVCILVVITISEKRKHELISDPVYGDGLTQAELDQFKEEDENSDASAIVIEQEFQIELGEDQATAGL